MWSSSEVDGSPRSSWTASDYHDAITRADKLQNLQHTCRRMWSNRDAKSSSWAGSMSGACLSFIQCRISLCKGVSSSCSSKDGGAITTSRSESFVRGLGRSSSESSRVAALRRERAFGAEPALLRRVPARYWASQDMTERMRRVLRCPQSSFPCDFQRVCPADSIVKLNCSCALSN